MEEFESVNFLSICAIADSYEHSLTIDRVLYEMTGDLECAAVLSRLRYWFSPGRDGMQRTRIFINGKNWMARRDDDWEQEACVRKKQMSRVKKELVRMGLVEIAIYKFNGNPTTHWNLNIQRFTELYNEIIKKMISKYPNGEKRNTPMGKKENPQTGISYNKHIRQASYSSHLGHICPDEENALFHETDELGNPVYHEKLALRGNLKKKYETLTFEQKLAVTLLRNVPPVDDQDERFELVTAVNLASAVSLDRIRKAIRVYQQRIKRGDQPRKMGAYLKEIIDHGFEPEPAHAEENKQLWKSKKGSFPEGSYIEHRDYVEFPRIDREITWRMSPEVFQDQLKRILNTLKDL